MDSASTRDSQVRIGFAPEEVTVLNWPLQQEGVRAWGMLIGTLLFVAGIGWWLESAAIAAALAVVFVAILWRLWLPVHYEFRRHGIVQIVWGRRRRIPWNSIASYRSLPSGVLLIPDVNGQPLSSLHGLFIAWGGRRAEIKAHLDFYLGTTPSEASASDTATAPQLNSGS
jgi:hypothetical protein